MAPAPPRDGMARHFGIRIVAGENGKHAMRTARRGNIQAGDSGVGMR